MCDYPFVSVVIPVRNEAKHIEKCLDSVFANDYPPDRFDVIVVDGESSDDTAKIVLEIANKHNNLYLLNNPARIVPTAMNLAIKQAKGEIIIRMDGHAVYAPDYVRQCVETLTRTGAGNVGGLQRSRGTDYISNSISIAVMEPFGIGDAKYRYSENEMLVDTVFLGAWKKSTLEAVGGFNDEWVVNQDYELNYRIRKAGHKIVLSPAIKCWYYVRPTLRGLSRQYFRYGFWRVKTLKEHPESLRWRQLVPPGFVLFLGVSLGLFPLIGWFSSLLPGLYLLATLMISSKLAARNGLRYLPALFLIFPIIHLSWGTGFLYGLIRWGAPRTSLTTLFRAFTQSRDIPRDTVKSERS